MRRKQMKMSPKHIKAKMAALDALLKESGDMEADELDNEFKGLKKVTVAANSNENLEEGLEKAKDLLENDEFAEEKSENSEEKMEDEQENEMSDMGTELSLPSKLKEEDEIEESYMPKMKSEIKKKKPKLNFFE
jgi:hypothetical protein